MAFDGWGKMVDGDSERPGLGWFGSACGASTERALRCTWQRPTPMDPSITAVHLSLQPFIYRRSSRRERTVEISRLPLTPTTASASTSAGRPSHPNEQQRKSCNEQAGDVPLPKIIHRQARVFWELMSVMRPERQRLSIDPYYSPHFSDVFDPSSPQSSPSPSSFYLPQSAVSLRLDMPTTPRSAPEWRLCFALCLYDFDPTDPDHLPFGKNEILEIVRKEESGWWAALRGDEVGWIPSAFVAEISTEDAEHLSGVRMELRVCEWEAEKLFSSEPTPASEPQRSARFPYYSEDWDNAIEPEVKVR